MNKFAAFLNHPELLLARGDAYKEKGMDRAVATRNAEEIERSMTEDNQNPSMEENDKIKHHMASEKLFFARLTYDTRLRMA